MTNGIIARIVPVPTGGYSDSGAYFGVNPAFPITNLADPQPKTVVQSNGGAGQVGFSVDIDFGGNVSFDGIAAIGTNLSSDGYWEAFATANGTPLPAIGAETGGQRLTFTGINSAFGVAPTTTSPVRHALALGTSISRRYLRIYIKDNPAANVDGVVRVGIIAAVQLLIPAFNYELGSGRKIEDQSIIRTLPGGETAIERGGRTPLWRATFSNLLDGEMRSLWSILSEAGTSAPLILCEDPDIVSELNERIHYGLLTGLDFNERVQADKQRIDLTIREMI